jgi:beta-glucosidase
MIRSAQRQPVDESPLETLDALVRSLSLEDRARLTSGSDAWHQAGVASIGLGPMLTLDGPNGVRAVAFPAGSSATCTPCGSALGATWDPDLVAEIAARIGFEAGEARVHYMLAPFLNLIRSPLGGRDFEAFSEDPILTAVLGAAYVRGLQSEGVAACPKHLVGNESEEQRTTVDCIIDERTLREVYLVPFEAAANAGAWSMMAAYNLLNGTHCTRNADLVRGILRGEWEWEGVLMSDWHATHDTVESALAGLDLEMPGPALHYGPALAEAVRRGDVPEETLNEMALRLLRLAERVGALDTASGAAAGPASGAAAGPASGAAAGPASGAAAGPLHLSDSAAAALVRRAAAESFTLLRNEGMLPIDPSGLRRVAVIGPVAATPSTQGGGAAHISAPYEIAPLDGLRAAMPGVELVHEQGCEIPLMLPPLSKLDLVDLDGRPGLTEEFFEGQEPAGTPIARFNTKSSVLHLFGDLPPGVAQDNFSVRLSAWLVPAVSGTYRITVRGLGGRRLLVNGHVVAEDWQAPSAVDVPTAMYATGEEGGTFQLTAGERVLVSAELHSDAHRVSLLGIGCEAPTGRDLMAAAEAAARDADLAIVVVGTDSAWETEGRDRKSADLPGRQNELVEKILEANDRTIVIVNAGSPMNLPWAERAPALMVVWFSGQEFGNALADVLVGRSEPGGRLPVTLAARDEDYPAFGTVPGPDGRLVYAEGLNVGYRGFEAAGTTPAFPFGQGLGYTTFEFESMTLQAGHGESEPVEIRVRLRNTGHRPGKEVVQAYVAPLSPSVPRPRRELKGFVVVRLQPGESVEVGLVLQNRDLAHWDVAHHAWKVDPGRYEIQVGRSSADIRLREAIELA